MIASLARYRPISLLMALIMIARDETLALECSDSHPSNAWIGLGLRLGLG